MDAFKRVWLHAQSHEGDSRVTTGFLLCLYNGNRFPFDMTNFRMLNKPIFDDYTHIFQIKNGPKKRKYIMYFVSKVTSVCRKLPNERLRASEKMARKSNAVVKARYCWILTRIRTQNVVKHPNLRLNLS